MRRSAKVFVGFVTLRFYSILKFVIRPKRFQSSLVREAIHASYFSKRNYFPLNLDTASYSDSLTRIIGYSNARLNRSRVSREFNSSQVTEPNQERSKKVIIFSNTINFVGPLVAYLNDLELEEIVFANLEPLKDLNTSRLFQMGLLYPEEVKEKIVQRMQSELRLSSIYDFDTWIIDWCLDNAVFFSKIKPKGIKLVIRIHKNDAFAWYSYLVAWDNVDHIVFVSETVRDAFKSLHKTRIGNSVFHVARIDKIDTFRFSKPKNKNIAVLQYALLVKDPQYSLNLLRYFVNMDPEWKMYFAGPDWESVESKKKFDQNIRDLKLTRNVIIEGYQKNVDGWFSDKAVILSSSLSEGSHEAVREGIRNGLTPLIRNWPSLKEFGGAKGAYPELTDYIFENFAEAYSIIQSQNKCEEQICFHESDRLTIENWKRVLGMES